MISTPKQCTRCKKLFPPSSFISEAKPSKPSKWCAKCRDWSRTLQQKTRGHKPFHEYKKPDGWCFGCKQSLPLESFYITPSQTRGYSTLCKSCTSKRNKIHNKRFKETLKSTKEGRERLRKLRYREFRNAMSNPERKIKLYAGNAARAAIRKGILKREPCQVCGETNVHAHHHDYSKPLDVIWLCKTHHEEIHRQ